MNQQQDPNGKSLHEWLQAFFNRLDRPQLTYPPTLNEGSGWRVALLDNGFCGSHPVFRGASVTTRDFTSKYGLTASTGHGTSNASILIGQGNGWLRGILPRCHLLYARVLGLPDPRKTTLAIARAVRWVVQQQADVVILPFGVRRRYRIIHHELQRAAAMGCSLFASAGNRGPDISFFPATLPFICSVGALGSDGERLSCCCAHGVDKLVPGEQVPAVGPHGLTTCTGSSPAAVIAAGMVVQQSNKRIRPVS